MAVIKRRSDFAKIIRPGLAKIGYLPAGTALLGDGTVNKVIVKDFKKRLVYYYNLGQPTVFAPLALDVQIAAINNPQYAGTRIRLGRPNYRPDVVHVMGIDAVEGVAAGGGLTPEEQYVAKAQYPDVGSLINFRLSPNDPPDSSVYISPGYYYDADGNLQFFGGDLFDFQDIIDALSSGQHQMGVVSLDNSIGELDTVTNTASDGGVDDKAVFNQTTIVEMTYSANDEPKGAVHLYEGQTEITEADIYRKEDPRVLFSKPIASSGSGFPAFGEGVLKTLASDVVSAGSDRHLIVAAETGTVDDLIEITGLAIGDEVIIRPDAGDTITVKDNDGGATDKILLYNEVDLDLTDDQTLKLVKIEAGKVVQYVDEKGSSGGVGQYILIQDQQPQNTREGGTAGSWQTRILNTIVADDTGAVTLVSNQFTLPAGTYRVNAHVPGVEIDRNQARLYNITDSAVALLGTSVVCQSTVICQSDSIIMGRITIASTKTFEIQHQIQTSGASYGFGLESNFSTEIYTSIELIKE